MNDSARQVKRLESDWVTGEQHFTLWPAKYLQGGEHFTDYHMTIESKMFWALSLLIENKFEQCCHQTEHPVHHLG